MDARTDLLKLKSLAHRYTPSEFVCKVREKLASPYRDYDKARGRFWPSPKELEAQRAYQGSFPRRPMVSIVVPAYETDPIFLRRMVESCLAQTYGRWQLCIADASRGDAVREAVTPYLADGRICYRHLAENEGIAANTNVGLSMAEGEYLSFLDHDDALMPSALYEMVRAINETNADMLYSDEDKMSADQSHYMDPHFKLDFNAELLLGNNYVCHFLLVSRELLGRIGGMDSRYDGAQDFDFVLRASECARKVCHVPKVLYHWRMHGGSTAVNTDSKQYAYEAGRRAVEAALARRGYVGSVAMDNDPGFYRICYQPPRGISLRVDAWGMPSKEYQEVKRQLMGEAEGLGISVNWDEDVQVPEFVCARQGMVPASAPYRLYLNRGLRSVRTGSLEILLGSCARAGICGAGAKILQGGHGKRGKRVAQCGYWEKDGRLMPRFQNLPAGFKGYFHRAYLATEVAAFSPDFAIMKTGVPRQGQKMVVEPAAEATLGGRGRNSDGACHSRQIMVE